MLDITTKHKLSNLIDQLHQNNIKVDDTIVDKTDLNYTYNVLDKLYGNFTNQELSMLGGSSNFTKMVRDSVLTRKPAATSNQNNRFNNNGKYSMSERNFGVYPATICPGGLLSQTCFEKRSEYTRNRKLIYSFHHDFVNTRKTLNSISNAELDRIRGVLYTLNFNNDNTIKNFINNIEPNKTRYIELIKIFNKYPLAIRFNLTNENPNIKDLKLSEITKEKINIGMIYNDKSITRIPQRSNIFLKEQIVEALNNENNNENNNKNNDDNITKQLDPDKLIDQLIFEIKLACQCFDSESKEIAINRKIERYDKVHNNNYTQTTVDNMKIDNYLTSPLLNDEKKSNPSMLDTIKDNALKMKDNALKMT